MKKNFLMASVVATLLIAVLFMINQTNAQTATLRLAVNAGTISACSAATGIDVGTITASNGTTTLSGSTWLGGNFGCSDLKGDTGWNFTVVAGVLTGTPSGSIAATNILLTPSGAITVTLGSCASITAGAGGALNTAKNLITKASGYGQTCVFYLPSTQAKITVSIPAWTPVGTYQSTLTFVYPS